MNVFILCTGRSGSVTVTNACKHLTNFTAGHETLSGKLGAERLSYPPNHVEGDNRLSWMLGALDEKYGDDAIYVHLVRDREKVAQSLNRRWDFSRSIIKAYVVGIRMQRLRNLNDDQKLDLCRDYVDTINSNIRQFLKDKSKWMTLHLENMSDEFPDFWKLIGGEGDIEAAIKDLGEVHNPSREKNIIKKLLK